MRRHGISWIRRTICLYVQHACYSKEHTVEFDILGSQLTIALFRQIRYSGLTGELTKQHGIKYIEKSVCYG